MKRREFITLLGGTAAATPSIRALAQQPERVRRIGFLFGLSENDPEARTRIAALRQGLATIGWTETHNIRIEYRFAGGDAERVRAYAAELVALAPDVIVAQSSPVVAALKQATSTIPIVFVLVNDPVGVVLVASLAHPGGNITGFTFVDFEMIGKWVNLLKEITPKVARASLMFDPDLAPYFLTYVREIETGPTKLPIEVTAAPIHNTAEMEAAITRLAPGGGLIVAPDPFTVVNRGVIISLAARYRLPAIFTLRQDVVEGGLMSYGPDTADICERSAAYVDRILKGAKPEELSVQAPTKYILVINLKTAAVLGVTISSTLLAQADEVIE